MLSSYRESSRSLHTPSVRSAALLRIGLMYCAIWILVILSGASGRQPSNGNTRTSRPSVHKREYPLEASNAAFRELKQLVEQSEVTVVSTPLELMSAIAAGAAHLEVREHMDLSHLLPPSPGSPAADSPPEEIVPGSEGGGVYSTLNFLLGTMPPTLKSVQVSTPAHHSQPHALPSQGPKQLCQRPILHYSTFQFAERASGISSMPFSLGVHLNIWPDLDT